MKNDQETTCCGSSGNSCCADQAPVAEQSHCGCHDEDKGDACCASDGAGDCCQSETESCCGAVEEAESCCGSAEQDAGCCSATQTAKSAAPTSCCGGEQTAVAEVSSCCGTAAPAATSSCCSTISQPASSCCGSGAEEAGGCCAPADANKIDWLLWGCGSVVVLGYIAFLLVGHSADSVPWLATMLHTSYEMVNAMWWGILSAAFFVGLLGRIPRELVMSVLGKGGTKRGIFRATMAGLLLDLCNHGILMVAMKLYERGASIGQVMAFLIASPWNSLTLTLILIGLIGLKWTLLFIAGSLLIAWVSGWIFDRLVANGTLPANPHQDGYTQVAFLPVLKSVWKEQDWSLPSLLRMFWQGLKESKMVLRWVFFGVVLVALVRAFVPPEAFSVWFGASFGGLVATLIATTVIEVCSEGSSPIAADLVTRAAAPGNAFTFLMAGAATDYTEIMALQNTTKSWKIALFLPLVTVPQVLFIGWLMNSAGV